MRRIDKRNESKYINIKNLKISKKAIALLSTGTIVFVVGISSLADVKNDHLLPTYSIEEQSDRINYLEGRNINFDEDLYKSLSNKFLNNEELTKEEIETLKDLDLLNKEENITEQTLTEDQVNLLFILSVFGMGSLIYALYYIRNLKDNLDDKYGYFNTEVIMKHAEIDSKRLYYLRDNNIMFLKFLYLSLIEKEKNGEELTPQEQNNLYDQRLLLNDYISGLSRRETYQFDPAQYLMYKGKSSLSEEEKRSFSEFDSLKEAYDYQRVMHARDFTLFDSEAYQELENKSFEGRLNKIDAKRLYDMRLVATFLEKKFEENPNFKIDEERLNKMVRTLSLDDYLKYIGTESFGDSYALASTHKKK